MPHRRVIAAGFSLIEVMISIALLAITVASLFSAMATADQVGERARLRDLALNELQRQIDNDRALAYTLIRTPLGDPTFDVAGLQVVEPAFSVPGVIAAGRTKVGLKQWTNSNGTQRTINYSCAWVDRSGPAWISVDVIIPPMQP